MNTLKILSFLLASAPAFAAVLDNIDFFSIASNATEGQGAFRCGASLIYPDILLTASFCIIAGDVIRVGYKNDTYSHAIRTATLVRNHPKAGGVHDENYANDLALVKLDEPVMDIVPMSINKDRAEPTDTNDAVYFAHAGQLTDNKTPFSLGVISLPPVPNFATEVQTGMTNTIIMKNQIGCIDTYRDHAVANKQGHKSKLEEAVQFCVPSNATGGPCDNFAWGSPMWFMNGTGATVQAGIASQGGCSPGSPPFIYTRVSKYYKWIQETMLELTDVKSEDST